ncbi:MAG: trimethylamine methyltransferase family protein [Candidatus Bathyarchaeota archaeon]|nr:MAG: trimethylamine methyltransferase family protein [Candidatus Bathyarchaeota archaeon]
MNTLLIPSAVTHGNVIYGLGMLESGMSVSLEQYVICDEIAQAVRESKNGIPVADETLDLDTILKVGVAGNYLSEPSTLKNLNAFWLPDLLDRDWRKEWEAKGWKNLFKRACERVDEIFATYESDPLPQDINDELMRVAREADKRLSRADIAGRLSQEALTTGVY